ncbi:nitrate reductase [Pararobbsia silviterrae]|uniref:Nitrate reductase n=1 Tax=Pararobbsia silviterrae TaxID=1792498 RepID=A0A494XSA9_9BURK|nr:nitrate reductase [Pararobbsia silviterrae]
MRTTCPYCGVGCGVRATRSADGRIVIAGDEDHPANRGRLCVKGSALAETTGLEGRLLHPKMRACGGGALHAASWSEALDAVASGFRRVIEQHGPDAVAFYVSGQLLTEDYYVANKLMKGYIGSANIDTNSRLCMSSSVAGHKRAFGEDLVPLCYEDLELADLIVLVGSNTAWCHPVLFQRIVKAKAARPALQVVVIDPRRTATCELADLHLPLASGTDVWLFNGLLAFLADRGVADATFINDHTVGHAQALEVARSGTQGVQGAFDLEHYAGRCNVDPQTLLAFYRMYARTERVITVYSMGVNQSSAGTDKVNSIINCHLQTGRIGKPGMGPFSFTGQPNAMGGREVGGLANMLAAHMELDNPRHRSLVQGFWGSPTIADRPGLKAVELFEAIEAGRVKAIWIMCTNPVVSMPDSNQVKRALQRCELVVSSDCMEHTDTHAFAHVLLPALGWGEKNGTVTNSERRISRQRPLLDAPGEGRPDWQIVCDVARRMGYAGFDFAHPFDVFDEHARLSAWGNVPHERDGGNGTREEGDDGGGANGASRVFNLTGLIGLGRAGYDALQPVQWPVRTFDDGTPRGTERLLSDLRFSHPDGKARFIATAPRSPVYAIDCDYPLTLNTGRVRDQWHTMSRTGKSATLASHVAEAFVDMHPDDASRSGVREGELARVSTRWGSMLARVQMGGGMSRGSVFVPIHWNDQVASDARVGAVVNPAVCPVSGEPEFKHTPVRIEPFECAWYGFTLSRAEPALEGIAYWTRIQGKANVRYELAGREPIGDYGDWARRLLGVDDPNADLPEYIDRHAGVYRAVHVREGRIESCVFISARPESSSRAWLAGLFAKDALDADERLGLLVGEPLFSGADTGPTVCACFGVGRTTICAAIREQGLTSAAQITASLKAGSNCGSCLPELKKLLAETESTTLVAS